MKRRHPDSNRGMKVLQTSALPLGYAAFRSVPDRSFILCRKRIVKGNSRSTISFRRSCRDTPADRRGGRATRSSHCAILHIPSNSFMIGRIFAISMENIGKAIPLYQQKTVLSLIFGEGARNPHRRVRLIPHRVPMAMWIGGMRHRALCEASSSVSALNGRDVSNGIYFAGGGLPFSRPVAVVEVIRPWRRRRASPSRSGREPRRRRGEPEGEARFMLRTTIG